MTLSEKKSLLRAFEQGTAAFDDVPAMPEALILFRPFEDAWSIKEQIVHCLDVDIANFHRYRRAVAQPDTPIQSFNGGWTSALDYQAADLQSALEAMRAVRTFMAAHLRSILDRDWTRYAYLHDRKGRMTLEEALADYVGHVDFHRRLIDRNIAAYRRSLRMNQ